MTWWGLAVRGIRHRPGRSAVVALLAAVAVAAAVMAPGFSRAAQQSVLTDGLASAQPVAAGVTVGATGTAGGNPVAHQPTGDARLTVDTALADLPTLDRVLGTPVGGVDTPVVVSGAADEPLASRFAYRTGVCAHLTITGECPIDAGQALVSERTAEELDIAPGDTVAVAPPQASPQTSPEVEVVGTYQPVDAQSPYWGRTVYFAHGGFDPTSGAMRTDAVFTPAETDVQDDPDAVTSLALTYLPDTGAVRLDDVPGLRADLDALHDAVRVADLELDTALPAILDSVAQEQQAISRATPVVAVPLLLLAFFVLFLLVATLTEERGREVALAKLRGYPAGRASRFGLGEVLLLIVAAAPVGVGLGLGLVELASRVALAGGTGVELRAPVLLAAALALAVAALAAVLAGRSTLRRGVLALLRRVPERHGWRAGVGEGMVVALAAASLVAAVSDRTSPLALLAPALLAVVAGIGTARLVRLVAALRFRLARRRGRIPAMLSAAQLSRRPSGRRIVVVVTVAVALLSFAATAWDVAAQARHDHAVDSVGAERVYSVQADHPTALLAAVDQADPDGGAMAVVRSRGQYAGEPVELLAVQSPRLADVTRWRGYDSGQLAAVLRPAAPEPLELTGDIAVRATVSDPGEQGVRLTALVSSPGQPPAAVSLGTLQAGTGTYRAELPQCVAGQCRLLGLMLGRAAAAGEFTAGLTVSAIRTDGSTLSARLSDPDAWQLAEPDAAQLSAGPALGVDISGEHSSSGAHFGDVVIEHRDSAGTHPAVLAGPAPAEDPEATAFDFPGFSERPEPFSVVDTATRLPRVGERGLLFDLESAVAAAERSVALADSTLTYEVWAGPAASADLAQQLAAAGVVVTGAESLEGTREALGRQAPALSLGLYLLAAGLAVAMALGVVALSGRIGIEHRLYELAALRVAGVRTGLLRRGLLREYAALLGWPLVVGFGTGLLAAALMLPGTPLVETGVPVPAPTYQPAFGALAVAAAVTAAGLVLAALRALRLPGRATADRLREGWA